MGVVKSEKTAYRDKLINMIKEAGEELIDRAEEMVDERTVLITDFHIHIDFAQGDFPTVPEISWATSVACKEPVPEIASEKTFDATKADWIARKTLAMLSGLSVNDTTQNHVARIIFGNDNKPRTILKKDS